MQSNTISCGGLPPCKGNNLQINTSLRPHCSFPKGCRHLLSLRFCQVPIGNLYWHNTLKFFQYWYEVARPLSSDLKGGRHINCPYGCVGRGRVRVVIPTKSGNLPRQGPEKARKECGSYLARGGPAKAAGRSIKRMVQPREKIPEGYCWESPGEG
jgi:hypothetical protein